MSAADRNVQLVKAFIRQRPFTKNEIELRLAGIIHNVSPKEITVKSGSSEKKFTFDQVFTEDVAQEEVYDVVVSPLIEFIISGYNCTVFAYGQTGTGKTHTMIGDTIGDANFDEHSNIGMIPRAASHLFSELNKLDPDIEYTVTVSFLEIYNEEVRDLLVKDSVQLRIYDDPENKGSTCIRGLTEVTVCNPNEVYEWLTVGTMERQTAATNLNRHSSRSHTIFTLQVHTRETTSEGEEITKTGKLNLIDLAGSENISRSGATDMRAREAGTINKSLLTLGKVIKALAQRMNHIPYRDSKLTRILQDSLGGNSKTCMIATFSPCVNAWDETVNTLDYARVVRNVANCPTVNINRKQLVVLKNLKDEIALLRQEVFATRTGDGFFVSQEAYDEMSQEIEKKNERVRTLLQEAQRLENIKSEKERQYREQSESFQKTKLHLDSTRKELKDKATKLQESDYLIKYMHWRNLELTAAGERLIEVSTISNKHVDILQRKYDVQCNSTLNNATIASNLYSNTMNCLKEIQHSSDHFVENIKSSLEPAKKSLDSLQTAQLENLNTLNQFSHELQDRNDNNNLNFESVLENDETKFYENDYLLSILNGNETVLANNYNDIKSSIQGLQNYFTAKTAEIELRNNDYSELIENEIGEESVYCKATKTLLNKLHGNILQIQNRFEEQNKNKKIIMESFLKYFDNLEQDNITLLEETALIEDMIKELVSVLQRYEEKRQPQNLKEKIVEYEKFQEENAEKEIVLIDSAISTLQRCEESYQEQISSDKVKTESYFTNMAATLKNNVCRYNDDVKNTLSQWSRTLISMKENLKKCTTENNATINNTIDRITHTKAKHNSDVKQFIQQSSDTLLSIKNNIMSTSHSGDTPIKEDYDYPRSIKKRISNNTLFEEFRNSKSSETLNNSLDLPH